ncbi:hypothetical protein [Variovorax sp. PAMC 28711]|uniref:hypothetical protein n=1 Tax=Variovorax sp. PAMC 28711 TaxID=1795631 RepID=UPI000AE5C1D7|nr:hypothetical protein [Variovorax sp. PAMC 28711]
MLKTPLPFLAVAVAVAVLVAGCSSASKTAAPASAAAAAPAPAAPVAPPPPPAVEGLDYRQLTDALGEGNEKGLKADLVGKTTTLTLAKAGRGAPAGTYAVEEGDATFFRCRAMAPGFSGGTVTTKIRDYRFVPKSKQKIVDLDRCAVAVEPARPAPVAAAAPAPQPTAPSTVGAGKAGMDARGTVVDSSKVEAGSGRTVKGLNDFEGEITGNPAPNSKFTKLQIGMTTRQVQDLIGPATDQGAYMTGKAWIPFYFGADRHRFEMTYKGQGRLIFAGGGMGDFSSGNLIWIIHNPNESGYR